ncbi:MAG TPA: hypothetical protein PLA97_15655 [Rubrivivax sp.]|nr:hypothetical protein [Rubrivivax sp.]
MLGLWVVLPLVAVVVIAVTWNAPPPWASALTLALTLAPLLLLGRLVIELRGGTLHWRYGYMGWPRWHVALEEIVEIKLARGPSAHAGIQFNGRQRVFTASLGSPAVELTLRNGRRVLLGSPEPDRLARFIHARLPEGR